MQKPPGYEDFVAYQQFERKLNKLAKARMWYKLAFIFFVIGLLFPWAWAITLLCILAAIITTTI